MKADDTGREIKIDDDFFKMPEEPLKPIVNNEDSGIAAKIKNLFPILLPAVLILIIIIGIVTVFLRIQISAAQNDIVTLNNKVSSIDMSDFKSSIAAMDEKIESVNKENDRLKSDLAQLRNEMVAIKAKKEKADASVQKKVVPKKKAPAKSSKTR